jgi:hypothetical protein
MPAIDDSPGLWRGLGNPSKYTNRHSRSLEGLWIDDFWN